MRTQFDTQSPPTEHGVATRAGRHRSYLRGETPPLWGSVVIRMATAGDRSSLQRLAALDSAAAPKGPTLIAELRERAVAALSLDDGQAIADPFVPTRDIVALLELRATQLNAAQLNARRRRSPLPPPLRAAS